MTPDQKKQAALDYHAHPRPGKLAIAVTKPVSYTHLTLPTIYPV